MRETLTFHISYPIPFSENRISSKNLDVMRMSVPLQVYFKAVYKTSQVNLTVNIYVYFLAFGC